MEKLFTVNEAMAEIRKGIKNNNGKALEKLWYLQRCFDLALVKVSPESYKKYTTNKLKELYEKEIGNE